MKKIMIILVIILTLCLLVLLAEEVFGGGVFIDFEIPDQKTEAFAKEFMLEMQKKKILTSFFTGDYFVRGYLGVGSNQKTGETKSMIGIFIDEDEEPAIIIFYDNLFSKKEIVKKAKEAAEYIINHLKEKEEKRKKSIKIPV